MYDPMIYRNDHSHCDRDACQVACACASNENAYNFQLYHKYRIVYNCSKAVLNTNYLLEVSLLLVKLNKNIKVQNNGRKKVKIFRNYVVSCFVFI